MARGKHLFPFRTEPLSPSAPMVLGPQGPGRVGRRRFLSDPATALTARRGLLLSGSRRPPSPGRERLPPAMRDLFGLHVRFRANPGMADGLERGLLRGACGAG